MEHIKHSLPCKCTHTLCTLRDETQHLCRRICMWETVSVLSGSPVTSAWQIIRFSRKWASYGCEGIISAVKMVVCWWYWHLTCLHACHLIADCRKLKLYCLSGIKGHKVLVNFHENCQLVQNTAWWFNTVGFWQWWCFGSIFFYK
jgi:hypothetical protein